MRAFCPVPIFDTSNRYQALHTRSSEPLCAERALQSEKPQTLLVLRETQPPWLRPSVATRAIGLFLAKPGPDRLRIKSGAGALARLRLIRARTFATAPWPSPKPSRSFPRGRRRARAGLVSGSLALKQSLTSLAQAGMLVIDGQRR